MNKKLLAPVLSLIFFLALAAFYASPILSGKTLSMHDVNMASGLAKELTDYHKETGIWAWWTNSAFGGMPGYMIAGDYPYSFISKLGSFITNALPTPINIIFLLMAGFYLLMVTLKQNKWVAVLGSVAYAFGTANLLYLEAGHVSKILALAYVPCVLAGFILIFRKEYILGTLVTTLAIGLELGANHLQITYYLFFVLLAYSVYELVGIIKQGDFKALSKIILCFVVSILIGVGSHGMRLWNNMTYSAETTRGKSELTQTTAGKDGLDKNYAFGWSYGIDETFNLIIPNLMGGGTVGELSKTSETYKTMTSGGIDAANAAQFIKQLPLYFGEQSPTSGPFYSGVIVVFLFILGLFLVKSNLKWVVLALALLFIVFAWGYHFMAFNGFAFDHLPGLNKFRAVTMNITIAHFLFAVGAAMGLNEIITGKYTFEEIKKPLYYSFGIMVLLMLTGYLMVDFSGPNDAQFKSGLAQSLGPDFAQKILNAMQDDRASMATGDILRGIILMLLVSAIIWLFVKQKIKETVAAIVLILLVVFDMIGVDKRYFNNDDFVNKFQAQQNFEPNAANLRILEDKDPNFRVLNTTTGFWSDATDSYFHKSIGGYHGAKLKRTQELFENQMVKNGQFNMPIYNMLNTKYFIVANQNNQVEAQLNPLALGNAWFVDSLRVVNSADEEMKSMDSFNPGKTAFVDKRFIKESKVYQTDSTDKIKLTSYKPNELIYQSDSDKDGFAVFSEMYYRGNQDWISSIDGKVTPHVRANYVLRAMEIPAGKHEIKFEFKPVSVEKGKLIDLVSSILLGGLIALTIYQSVKKK